MTLTSQFLDNTPLPQKSAISTAASGIWLCAGDEDVPGHGVEGLQPQGDHLQQLHVQHTASWVLSHPHTCVQVMEVFQEKVWKGCERSMITAA